MPTAQRFVWPAYLFPSRFHHELNPEQRLCGAGFE